MNQAYEQMLDLFAQFLRADDVVVNQIKRHGGALRIERGALLFTLPAMAGFLHVKDADYVLFRKAVFSNPTGLAVEKLGGRVVLVESTGKVDTNVYRLERIASSE